MNSQEDEQLNPSEVVPLFNGDAWDDSLIMEIFNESVTSHKCASSIFANQDRQSNSAIRNDSSKKISKMKALKSSSSLYKHEGSSQRSVSFANDSNETFEKQESSQRAKGKTELIKSTIGLKRKLSQDIDQNSGREQATWSLSKNDIINQSLAGPWESVSTADTTMPISTTLSSVQTSPPSQSMSTSISTDDAMRDMLHAWYQAGYSAGRYDVLVELERKNDQASSINKS